ncbi:MAG: DUF2062 domain-containing protein [Thermodesulfobacteriota bacterium]
MANSNNKKNGLFTRLKRKNRLFYLRVLRQTDAPETIALGASIGVAAGILPTFGLGALLAMGISHLAKANKVAAVLGSFIMNPITTPFFWTLSSAVGGLIFWKDLATITSAVNEEEVYSSVRWALIVFLTGNIIVSLVFAVIAYFVVKRLIITHRAKKLARLNMRLNGSRSK